MNIHLNSVLYTNTVDKFNNNLISLAELLKIGFDSFENSKNKKFFVFNAEYFKSLLFDQIITFDDLVNGIKTTSDLKGYFENSEFFEFCFEQLKVSKNSHELFFNKLCERHEFELIAENAYLKQFINNYTEFNNTILQLYVNTNKKNLT